MTEMSNVFPNLPQFGETVYFEHGGRVVSGVVRSTCTGAGFNEIVAFSTDLGHTNRIDDGVRVQVADLLPVPTPTTATANEPDLTYNLPEGANMALVTGEPQQPAPSFADDVAKLRRWILHHRPAGQMPPLAALDRIAERVPQMERATDLDGDQLWQHTCGYVTYGEVDDTPPQVGCAGRECFMPGEWRALYVIPGGAK